MFGSGPVNDENCPEYGCRHEDVVYWASFTPTFVDIGTEKGFFAGCWCMVTEYEAESAGLTFTFDPSQRVPATHEDVEILTRARAFLSDASRWERNDTRNRNLSYCPPDTRTRTIFCALYHATVSVRGEYYGGPAVSVIQDAIRLTKPTSSSYRHPVTDFNNDPAVDLATVQRMFEEALRLTRESMHPAG
jgi:hypothetical protein